MKDKRIARIPSFMCRLCGATFETHEEAVTCADSHVTLDNIEIDNIGLLNNDSYTYLPGVAFPFMLQIKDKHSSRAIIYSLYKAGEKRPLKNIAIDEATLAEDLDSLDIQPEINNELEEA